MTLRSRREMVNRIADRYRESMWGEKRQILDEFVAATGYGRKHAIALLNHGIKERPAQRRNSRPRLMVIPFGPRLLRCGMLQTVFVPSAWFLFYRSFWPRLNRLGTSHWNRR
jgi:hypothetical protein